MVDFKDINRNILFYEDDFYSKKDLTRLSNLCVKSYRNEDFHMAYLYSKIGIEKTGIDAFYLYLILSLFKMGYLSMANELLKKNYSLIEGLFLKDTVDICDMIELVVLFEIKDMPYNIKAIVDTGSSEIPKLFSSLYKVKSFGSLEDLNRLVNYFEIMEDCFYKRYISTILGEKIKTDYFNYALNNNFITPNMLEHKDKLEFNESIFKIVDVDIVGNFKKHNYISDSFKFYSYPYEDSFVNMYILEYNKKYLVFDCGGYNIENDIVKIDAELFIKTLKINYKDIEGVFITHAHLDHYGSMDLLKNKGLKFFMTMETYDLIQKTGFNLEGYDLNIVKYNDVVNLKNFNVIPFKNGHILGSCGYDIFFGKHRVVYTGDFCLNNQNTVEGLNLNELIKRGNIDLLAIEGTYINKKHNLEYVDNSIILSKLVKKLSKYGVKTLIPSFAIGRAQEVALILKTKNALFKPALIDGEASDITYYFQRKLKTNIVNSSICVSNCCTESKYDNYNVFIASSGMFQKDSTSYKYYNKLKDNDLTVIKVGYINQSNNILNELRLMDYSIMFFDVPLSGHASYNQLIETIVKLEPENTLFVHTF